MQKKATCLCLTIMLCAAAAAQSTETVLYSFGAYPGDGQQPFGGPLFDAMGNIYGVTLIGGSFCQVNNGCGTVFELSPSANGWTESILYSFCTTGEQYTCPDGSIPQAGLIGDAAGNLYGTTTYGGTGEYGTVFRLSPPTGGGGWTESVLWNFTRSDPTNGWLPGYGRLNMDAAGNLYGTTGYGGANGVGTVFELSPKGDGTYTFSILHSFVGGKGDGAHPLYGVSFDKAGNLYGTTLYGGPANAGTVYELTPSNGAWTATVLYHFNGKSGSRPWSDVSVASTGNLYGTFEMGGYEQNGGAFELAPQAESGYKEFSFEFDGQDGGQPEAGLLVDEATSSAYGTTTFGVFKLQGRNETVLYNFCQVRGCLDGEYPSTGKLVERGGLLYGETAAGGQFNAGVLYSLTK